MSDVTIEAATNGKSSIHSIIQNVYSDLSSMEKRIAEYILNSPERIMYYTVTQVAEDLGVAQSSVTRFCKNIGLRGFQELKIRLAQSNPQQDENQDTSDQSEYNLQKKLAQVSANSVLDAAATINPEMLKQAEETIANASKVLLYGVGESGAMVQLFQMKLMGLGLTAEAYTDIHLQSISAAHADEGIVVIGISQQGSTKDVVAAMRLARDNGAKTICITAQGKSPITEVADIPIICVQRSLSNFAGTFESKASILYVIELIAIMYNIRLTSGTTSSRAKLTLSTESILDKLY